MKTAQEYADFWAKVAKSYQDCYKILCVDFEEKRYDTQIDSEALIRFASRIQATEILLEEARENQSDFAKMLPDTLVGYTLARGILKGNKSEG